MSTVKNKVEKSNNDKMAATPKQKPVAKKPAAEKAPEEKQQELSKIVSEDCYIIDDNYKVQLVKKGGLVPISKRIYKVSDVKKAVADAKKFRNELLQATAKAEDKKEDTSVSMSTDAFSKEILTEFHKRTKAIKNSISKIDSGFETIAFNLHWINAKQAYKSEGHATIIEYAAENFGYQKSTCYSLISVVDRFAKRDEKGALMETFEDRVRGFSVSKLSLMCNLTDAEVDSLKPTMSVREIKKFVKGLEGKALPELSEGDGEVPEEENETTNDGGVVDVEAVVVSNTLIECAGKEDYEKKIDRIDEYIVRVFNKHPNAVISVSYSVPKEDNKKG